MANLANEGEIEKLVKIVVKFPKDMKDELIALLKVQGNLFLVISSYTRTGYKIIVKRIPVKSKCPLMRQALQKMKSEIILKIKEKVEKQLKAYFLTAISYSDLVANIVLMPKKDGKVRMCVDYRDLNRANLKDHFPLPHIDTLIDNTSINMFSFMDGFSGYNQIKMVEEDKAKIAFTTYWGTYTYDVMRLAKRMLGQPTSEPW